jgi:hypothetical protein
MSGLNHPLEYKKYFPQHMGFLEQGSEVNYFDDMVAEYFGIYGLPTDYFHQIVDIKKDAIFGEDDTKKYVRKYQLTSILKDLGAVQETSLLTRFGYGNSVDFTVYIHVGTFKRLVGKDKDPLPGDIFTFPNGNTKLKYNVQHVMYTTLGMDGNIFGHRSCYELTCKEAELSPVQFGLGEQYGVIDAQGNLLPDAPADALVSDGSGRIADKYQVPTADPNANKGDNAQITIEAGRVVFPRDEEDNNDLFSGW